MRAEQLAPFGNQHEREREAESHARASSQAPQTISSFAPRSTSSFAPAPRQSQAPAASADMIPALSTRRTAPVAREQAPDSRMYPASQPRLAVRERPSHASFPAFDNDWDVPAFQRKGQ